MEPAFLVTRHWKIGNCSQLILSSKENLTPEPEQALFIALEINTYSPYIVCFEESTTTYSACQALI